MDAWIVIMVMSGCMDDDDDDGDDDEWMHG